MKLAEALIERSDLQRRISELEGRLANNARVQEGEKPAEKPQELMKELDECIAALEELVRRINHTNGAVSDNGETITDLLAKRECQGRRINILRGFLRSASATTSRMGRSEIKILSTVPVAELQKKLDADAKALRELDTRIQALNWTNELL
ncbi:MAG: DIP1984 family protein [Oscillospiraceae bacterium]|jgi:tRNA C32,U32 (ribose-2'-O)-methylase TrmJ|nr:DIP1984 family protein [Oscillospiraceae bacterium]